MRVADIAVAISNKSQNRVFNLLCEKHNVKHLPISKVSFPTYMMLLRTQDGIVAIPNNSRKGSYGVESFYGCSVYTLEEFKKNIMEMTSDNNEEGERNNET